MRRFLASVAFGQALATATAVLMAGACFALVALTSVDRSTRADLLGTIDTDIAGLVDVAAQGGTPELARRVNDRTNLRSDAGPAAYYFLADAIGARLAGNLPSRPPLDVTISAAGEMHVGDDLALLRATRLRGDVSLYVGRSLSHQQALMTTLRRRLLWVGIGAVLAALIVAVLTAQRVRGRVGAINAAFVRFGDGDLSARINDDGRDGEFSVLAAHVDSHFERVARLLDIQREVSDNIAHELRTPLVHLDTRLRHLQEGNPGNVVAEGLEHSRGDIRSIVSLFDALLDIALTESTVILKRGDFDLSELAATIADLYAASAEEAGLDFASRITPDVMMAGEPMQISRLITNLLDNAFKFVGAGTRVRLTVANGPVLIVEDDGQGIAAADRERAFQRFQRLGPEGAGHGLGLALVRVIAARHGLDVRVENANPGARFIVDRGPKA